MNIRKVEKKDSAQLIELLESLDSETEFMLFEVGERSLSISEQERIINDFQNSSSKLMLVLESDESTINGFLVAVGGTANRNKHSLYCVLGIRQSYTGNGAGFKLLLEMESWAKSNQFHRLELTVMEHNKRAISLYESLGFEVEGLKKNALKVNGQYVNEYYMSKLIYA